MKLCTECKHLKHMENFHNRKDTVDGKDFKCKLCKKSYYEKTHPKKDRKIPKNKEYYAEKRRKEYALNPEKYKEINKKWISKNKESRAKYAKFYLAKRRSLILKASFEGFDADIRKIYENCPKGCHVDHIVPLKAKNMCGLHVPWNLQYLSAHDNLKKGNRVI